MAEGTILVGLPGDIPTPESGVTLFLNTADNMNLWYKNSAGTSLRANVQPEECCCIITENMMAGVTCALKNGMISMTEFNAFVAAGITVTCTSTDDGAGNTTNSVTVGPPAP
jgi:hypothetical protein